MDALDHNRQEGYISFVKFDDLVSIRLHFPFDVELIVLHIHGLLLLESEVLAKHASLDLRTCAASLVQELALLVPNLDQVPAAQRLLQLVILNAEQHRAVLVELVVAKGLLQTVQLVNVDVKTHALQHLGGVLGAA